MVTGFKMNPLLKQEIHLHSGISRKDLPPAAPLPMLNVIFIHNFTSVKSGQLQTILRIVFLELRNKMYFVLATKIFYKFFC